MRLDTEEQGESGSEEIEVVPLEGDFADLTLQIALGELSVPSAAFPGVRRVHWRGLDIEPEDASIRLDGPAMVIDSRVRPATFRAVARGRDASVATVELNDGSSILGTCQIARRSMSVRVDSPATAGLEFRLYEWDWNPDVAGGFLVAQVGSIPKLVEDNLSVEASDRASSMHLRVHGHAVWHIVTLGTGHVAIVDSNGTTPGKLRLDLQALEFVLGGEVDVTTLWKVNENGTVLGAVDLARPSPSTHNRRPPVPWGPAVRKCWVAPLFKGVSRALEHDKIVQIAVSGYLDSLSGHPHSAYLLAQVALEAACKRWHKSPSSTLVSNPAAWEKWVDGHAEEIALYARTTDAAKYLLKKLKSGAIQGATSEVVEAAFRAAGIDLSEKVLKEVVKRNSVAHDYYMYDENDEAFDIQMALDRTHVIQALLAAVVARRSGYDGPLAGWTRDDSGGLEPAEFWKSKPVPEALLFYRCGPGISLNPMP